MLTWDQFASDIDFRGRVTLAFSRAAWGALGQIANMPANSAEEQAAKLVAYGGVRFLTEEESNIRTLVGRAFSVVVGGVTAANPKAATVADITDADLDQVVAVVMASYADLLATGGSL